MSDNDKRSVRRHFRSDGTSVWQPRNIHGPGVWVTCVKGKEKQAIGELYELFEKLSEELWPPETVEEPPALNHVEDDDLEKVIAQEVSAMKKPRKERRFANCSTNTPCLLFISCKPPADPVRMIEYHMQNIEKHGVTHTRHSHRLVPVSGSCDANLAEISSLCKRIALPSFVTEHSAGYRKYKVELRIRSHNTLAREELLKVIAQCIPEPHKVDLTNPELFILVEIFKGVCGISVVRDYYRFKKYNVVEMAQAKWSE